MEIIWEAEDGYMGGARPQYLEIHNDDIAAFDNFEDSIISKVIKKYN